ncbi:Hopanoid-associated sugar epimerase [Trema orientale]|uniref:Hopanoid-associated sugar epimerase n=1 Tax=Trema orientale TaxID=63057 RepID=A0A2P5EH35_TREOI|nr:Hopanoid-associated sugar epimerase [Trema orientale]
MSGVGKVVCVTGASGYIASWLVKLLLQRGYTVKASVRDPKHLLALDGAKERLHLFKANLLEEGSFDSAIDGCDGVFHTASPLIYSATDPQVDIFLYLGNLHKRETRFDDSFKYGFIMKPAMILDFTILFQADIIDPAVKGTLSVLRSCAKAPSVKRVVITSSMISALMTVKPLTPDVVVDETWFSDPIFCENLKVATIGERPQTFPNIVYPFVDVRDVASAHIQAFEVASASGRNSKTEDVAHFYQALKILQKLYPSLSIPEKCEDNKPLEPKYKVSDSKAKCFGINFIPLEVSLRDTIESLKENGLFNI